MSKEIKVTKEQVKVEGGKVCIDSTEFANAIQDQELKFSADEEAGWNLFCAGVKEE